MTTKISKDDKHLLDPYLKWLANKKLMVAFWLVLMICGCMYAYIENDWSLLPRFGCLGIMIGTLLTLSPLFAEGIYLSRREAFGLGSVQQDGSVTSTSEKGRAVSRNILWGVIIIIISSIINAFGDLIMVTIMNG
ncbi:hypothetical protein ACX0CR_001977 [Escherichia coli]